MPTSSGSMASTQLSPGRSRSCRRAKRRSGTSRGSVLSTSSTRTISRRASPSLLVASPRSVEVKEKNLFTNGSSAPAIARASLRASLSFLPSSIVFVNKPDADKHRERRAELPSAYVRVPNPRRRRRLFGPPRPPRLVERLDGRHRVYRLTEGLAPRGCAAAFPPPRQRITTAFARPRAPPNSSVRRDRLVSQARAARHRSAKKPRRRAERSRDGRANDRRVCNRQGRPISLQRFA